MGISVAYPRFVQVDSIQSEEKDNIRYWLEIPFKDLENLKTLCVILKNPSKATTKVCDRTVSRVCNVAKNNGYSKVIILNLFPYRSTEAKGLLKFYRTNNFKDIMRDNLNIITNICNNKDVVFAWGTNTISKSKQNQNIYDSVVTYVTSRITNNTYYVRRCSCSNQICSSQHNAVRYPLHGLRWLNNSSIISY